MWTDIFMDDEWESHYIGTDMKDEMLVEAFDKVSLSSKLRLAIFALQNAKDDEDRELVEQMLEVCHMQIQDIQFEKHS